MRRALVALAALLLLAAAPAPARAHVGSPDVFFEGTAGPYRVLVTVRPPLVVPGTAEVEVRAEDDDLAEVRIVPMLATGEAARLAPTPDVAARAPGDPRAFRGEVWLMRTGAWQVRVLASGARGPGELGVPVPALPTRTLGMQRALATLLLALLAVLALGAVSVAGAAAREAPLEPGAEPGPAERRRGRRAVAIAAALALLAIYGGGRWWRADAADYDRHVYRPLGLTARVEAGELVLAIENPAWHGRSLADLVPDHGHLMHLFVLREPALDRIWHLHPVPRGAGAFAAPLPDLPAGRYQLFADIVHGSGLGETAAAEIDLPETHGAPLSGDDAAGAAPEGAAEADAVALAGGGRVVWERPAAPLRARETTALRFRVEDEAGRPAGDLAPYMGMPGHLAIVREDRRVFAHVHPAGSAPMAILEELNRQDPALCGARYAPERLPATVSFPYGFPSPGRYRLFLQVKRGARIETASFDAVVAE
jgi:hypothetical protein